MTAKKNRANASVGQKIWREPRISSLFVWRNKRWRSCRLHFFRLKLRWPSHISAEDCQYVWAVVDIDFFVRFVSRAEIVAFFFVEEGSQTRTQCAAVHSSLDTEKNIAAFPKIVVLIFFYLSSVQKMPVSTFRQL